jgi:hypothetical protein
LFGSLAWGVGSLVVGALIDANGLWVVFPFTYAMILLCLVVVGLNIQQQQQLEQLEQQQEPSPSNEKGEDASASANVDSVKGQGDGGCGPGKITRGPWFVLQNLRTTLLRHPQLTPFAVQVVLSGFCMTLADTVLPLQLDQEFGSSRKFNGGSTLVGIATSIPVFWWSADLLRVYGAWRMLRFAQILLFVRYFVLALLTAKTPWLSVVLLAQQLFHGCCFSIFWVASTDLVQSMATSRNDLTTSAQSLVSTLYFVCGQGLGNIFWMSLYGRVVSSAAPLYFGGCVMLAVNLCICHSPDKYGERIRISRGAVKSVEAFDV